MKRTLITALLLALIPALGSVAKARTKTIRLSTYNIQHGEGMDKKIDFERIGLILKEAGAEVVAVQEVDSMTRRANQTYGLQEIGRRIGMKDVYAPAIDYQGGKYGIGMLSKKKPLSVRRIPLPGREEPRMLLVVEFKKYVVACTHLSLTREDRQASIPIIAAEAARWQKPFFLMGDLNAEAENTKDRPFLDELTYHFRILNDTTAPTFPSNGPNICIDYIAVFKSQADKITDASSRVGTEKASDHCPLHAIINMKK